MSKILLTNFYSECFKKRQAFKIQPSRYRGANWDMFLNVTRSLPLTLSCETFTQGPWLLITAQHTAALLQFILQVFDLPADYLWASGSESEFFHPVYYHQRIPDGERSQWMIPPSNSILRVSTKTETATAEQIKAYVSEFTACRDGKMTVFICNQEIRIFWYPTLLLDTELSTVHTCLSRDSTTSSIMRQKRCNQIEGFLILGHVAQKHGTGSKPNSKKNIDLHLPQLWEWVWILPWRNCRCPQVVEEQVEKGGILELHSHYGVVWRTLVTVIWMVCPCTIYFVVQFI